MRTGYAPVNGIDLYYEVHGAGRPLVLLPGGLLTIDLNFGTVLPALAGHRQVIAVELQGHGRTADTGRPLTIERIADDVAALLDHLGVECADLYGFSLGGLVAFQYALRYPDRADHLVLASAQLLADPRHTDLDPARMPTEADFAAMRDAYLGVAPDPGHFADFQARLSRTVGTFASWPDATLRAVTHPTLLLYGDRDFIHLDDAVRTHALIPGARLAVLPGTTHMDMVRRAAWPLPYVESFLPGGAGG